MTTKQFETPEQSKFTIVVKTIKEYWEWIMKLNLELHPIGQRNDVDVNGLTKKRSIIMSILQGLDIGEVSFATTKESLDGGHRSRSILDFLQNKFKLPADSIYGEVNFSQLPQNIKDYFFDYKLRVTDFYELSGSAIGKQFLQTNNITPPCFAEKMNSFGTHYTILKIREYSQTVPDEDGKQINKMFRLFETGVAYANKRHLYFLQILESATLHKHKSFTNVKESDIREYVENTSEKEVKRIDKVLQEEFKFYAEIAPLWKKYYKKQISIQDFHIIRLIYWNLRERSNRFKVSDMEEFVSSFINKLQKFLRNNRFKAYVHKTGKKKGEHVDSKHNNISGAFQSYVKKVGDLRKFTQAKEWVNGLINYSCVVLKSNDGKSFPPEMILTRWREVNKIDEITGDFLPFESAVGCHIIPDCEGGTLEYDNLMVSSEFHNEKMGTMNALKYKEMYEKEMASV